MSKHLVIGCKGQVGSALRAVLAPHYTTHGIDLGVNDCAEGEYDVLHVCIPYNENFDAALVVYKKSYLRRSGLVIIHSTVEVGTSAHHDAVHSPIRGVHPNLEEGIRKFMKFFGGPRAYEAAQYFMDIGIRTYRTRLAANTEALKLWDTTYYGWNIVFEKAVKEYCDKWSLDFEVVYAAANNSYNDGYRTLGMANVQRPVLKHMDGPIGGHCVVPNARILRGPIADFILDADEKLRRTDGTSR